MTAVAEGAALAAGILLGIVTDLDFHVGTEHALGTVVHDGPAGPGQFSVLIARNTKYPAQATDVYAPATDFQDRVTIEVVEGDPDKPLTDDDNVVLKRWSIDLPERRAAVDAAFGITYEYDLDGILHVLVEDRKTGAVMMDEELTYGASGDRDRLPRMRRRVDELMADGEAAPEPPMPRPAPGPSPEQKPSTRPGPEPQPEPSSRPGPEPQPEPSSRPGPEPQPEPSSRPGPEPQPEPSSRPGPEPEPSGRLGPEPEPSSRPGLGLGSGSDLAAVNGLSAQARAAIARAEDEVLPFVGDADAEALGELVERLRSAARTDEPGALAALSQELRRHSYLP
jgi:hypothetical protein